jgi:hypothetical protein
MNLIMTVIIIGQKKLLIEKCLNMKAQRKIEERIIEYY